MNPDDICCICIEKLGEINIKTLQCNHKFHEKCINSWLLYKNRNISNSELELECPCCRATEIIKINEDNLDVLIWDFSFITFCKRRNNLMLFCFISSFSSILSLLTQHSPSSIITIAVSFYGFFGAVYLNVSLLFYYLLLSILDYIVKLFIIFKIFTPINNFNDKNNTKFILCILVFILFIHTYIIYITYYLRKNILQYHQYIKHLLNIDPRSETV